MTTATAEKLIQKVREQLETDRTEYNATWRDSQVARGYPDMYANITPSDSDIIKAIARVRRSTDTGHPLDSAARRVLRP